MIVDLNGGGHADTLKSHRTLCRIELFEVCRTATAPSGEYPLFVAKSVVVRVICGTTSIIYSRTFPLDPLNNRRPHRHPHRRPHSHPHHRPQPPILHPLQEVSPTNSEPSPSTEEYLQC